MITLLNKIDNTYVIEKKDILRIISSYIAKNNLQSYLFDVRFLSNSNNLGSYNTLTNVMILNDNRIIKSCYHVSDCLAKKYKISEDYYTYLINYYYLYILFHELEHVKQKASYENASRSVLFNSLYELCRELQRNDLKFYNQNHDLFPMEIEANNNGYLKAYHIISRTKLPKRELNILKRQYLFSLLNNYEKNKYQIIAPIDKLTEYNNTSIFNTTKILQESDLSKIERLNLGLGITSLEYDSIKKILTKTK